jgi:hypothetical protein
MGISEHNIKIYIIRVIKSRRPRQAGHVARMGESRGAYRVLVGKPERKKTLEDRGVDERKILKKILEKWDGAWTGSIWLTGTGGGSCERGDEPSGSIKCGEFLE